MNKLTPTMFFQLPEGRVASVFIGKLPEQPKFTAFELSTERRNLGQHYVASQKSLTLLEVTEEDLKAFPKHMQSPSAFMKSLEAAAKTGLPGDLVVTLLVSSEVKPEKKKKSPYIPTKTRVPDKEETND